ncbi:unnamed protein product [Microthlaspi erraticum]|uniref:Uncharacterized protein n=1 Tax=Microthlaspi erraticum TaxID=1685480 RepID=A0A6D2J9Y3_9BRAS|nr:unnamed protein product [Microthlaspi erraticum]
MEPISKSRTTQYEKMMHGGENSVTLPIDIILEILSRSSAKSIARFRLSSKFSESLFSRPDFTELLLTKSSARPRLLFAVKGATGEGCFYSSPQLHSSDERSSSSLVLAADFYMDSPVDMSSEISGPVSGLIYISKRNMITAPVIYNLSTGQYTSLPEPRRDSKRYLGFDPVEKQFKVLSISLPLEKSNQVLTLRAGRVMSWRKINISYHEPLSEGICINGVVYYLARGMGYPGVIIALFDVRSETLRFLHRHGVDRLDIFSSIRVINYKGKFGLIGLQQYTGRHETELRLFVLEDLVEKQERWSRDIFRVKSVKEVDVPVVVAGVTATGETVLSMDSVSKPFYVYYFNPESETTERVEIRGFEACEYRRRVHIFIDHVEDLKFIT